MVNFKNAIIIMTSNLGSDVIRDAYEGVKEKDIDAVTEKTKNAVLELLRRTLKPEFLNRVDEIVMFQPLSRKDIKDIVKLQVYGLKKLLLESNNIKIDITDHALQWLADDGYDPQFGARPLKRLIQKRIVNELSKKILAGNINSEETIVMDEVDGVIFFRNEAASAKQ